MKTVSLRRGAKQQTKHHFFNSEFGAASDTHLELRRNPAYKFGLRRDWHDRLEYVTDPVKPVDVKLARDLGEIGLTYSAVLDDSSRIDHLLDDITGIAIHAGPEISDQALEVATALAATKGIIDFIKTTY